MVKNLETGRTFYKPAKFVFIEGAAACRCCKSGIEESRDTAFRSAANGWFVTSRKLSSSTWPRLRHVARRGARDGGAASRYANH